MIKPKIRMLCFVLINSVLLNFLRVGILNRLWPFSHGQHVHQLQQRTGEFSSVAMPTLCLNFSYTLCLHSVSISPTLYAYTLSQFLLHPMPTLCLNFSYTLCLHSVSISPTPYAYTLSQFLLHPMPTLCLNFSYTLCLHSVSISPTSYAYTLSQFSPTPNQRGRVEFSWV